MVAVLSGGQQVRKDVDRLRAEFVRSPKKLTRRASTKLGLPGTTFWMVFHKRVRLKVCKVQSLQKQSSPATHHEGAWGERRYSSYLFLTSALVGGEWSASRPDHALPRRKDPRYPLYRRLGGPQSRSGHRGYRKNPLSLPEIEPRSPGRSVRSQTLYCLSYPAPTVVARSFGKV
jgi:hypothetical protein